jgi:2-succinyl-6-hydroxy-2,4-cyclohexadiene-1-carboxylate synthase
MLQYTTTGSPDQPAVVFLHGFMGRSADWAPIIDAMQDQAYCIAVDLPGHGRSTDLPEGSYTMEATAQHLVEIMDAEAVARSTVIGYSMGGRTALYFALRHPDRCARLILESASPGLRMETERAARRRVDQQRAEQIACDFDAFLHEWYQMPLFASLAQYDLVESMVQQRQHNRPAELGKSLRGMGAGAQPSLWERIATLRISTRALAGALDDKYVRITRGMTALNASLRSIIVPGAGHNVHAERPDAFINALRRFVD